MRSRNYIIAKFHSYVGQKSCKGEQKNTVCRQKERDKEKKRRGWKQYENKVSRIQKDKLDESSHD